MIRAILGESSICLVEAAPVCRLGGGLVDEAVAAGALT